jgi:hypothetical protein
VTKRVPAEVLFSLVCLLACPEQRLVHQTGDSAEGGVLGAGVFFRMPREAGPLKPKGGLHTLRAMLRQGWLKASPQLGYSFQLEYQISDTARARFDSDPEWALAEDIWRKAFGHPPRLRAVA